MESYPNDSKLRAAEADATQGRFICGMVAPKCARVIGFTAGSVKDDGSHRIDKGGRIKGARRKHSPGNYISLTPEKNEVPALVTGFTNPANLRHLTRLTGILEPGEQRLG